MRKHICLIIPPSPFLLDERVFMSLGILKVAAVLEQSRWKVDVLDLSGVSNYTDAVREYLASSEIVLFGVTATTPQFPATTDVVHVIRDMRASSKIILGGPHVTLVNAAYKNEQKRGLAGRATPAFGQLAQMFDVLVAGDGEEAIFLACEEDAPKLIDADDRHSPLMLDNERLTSLPFPARHLVEVESYHYLIDDFPALSLIAQLGCPFGCGFCGGRRSPMLRHIRTRSSENIVAEMLHMYETTGVRGFMMYDDELNVSPTVVELMKQIAGAQKKLGVEWRLRGFIKSELFTDQQAEAMFDAGFRWILVGFESGSPRILENINKKATRENNSRCVEIAHRHGLKVKALMSIGHPGESAETIKDTEDWLLEASPDDFDLSVITTYPGTPYYDDAVRGLAGPDIWTYEAPASGDRLHQLVTDFAEEASYYKGTPGDYTSHVFTDEISSEEIVLLRDQVENRVREILGIPFNQSSASLAFEHSMGMGPTALPSSILRVSQSG